MSRKIKEAGFCVYSLDYGNRATEDIRDSAQELEAFTERVLDATGAAKVSMVGHSQGGMMPRYYIKFLGGDRVVDDLVGVAPSNHGSSITGPPGMNPLAPILDALMPALGQQAAGSAFLTELNAGDETPGDVSYTQITTKYDEIVRPHTSGYLAPGPNTTNLTIQDVCGLELVRARPDPVVAHHDRHHPRRAHPRGAGSSRLPAALLTAARGSGNLSPS